jgi:polar amino acid transport system ATP-binding protein/putative ABC transport system ATP-binding protein
MGVYAFVLFLYLIYPSCKMIAIKHITLAYDDSTVLQDFSLRVETGESVCLTGGSGCGKTSLLRAVLGFVPLSAGEIEVDGISLTSHTVENIRKRVAWMPQELALPAEWVSEMVRIPFDLRVNRERGFDKSRLLTYFEELGLDASLYDKRVNEISGGQRQRIMLAVAALLHKPLLMVDEPTSALDAESVARVVAFFRKLCREEGMTVLAVSHDPHFAEGCDRIIRMNA